MPKEFIDDALEKDKQQIQTANTNESDVKDSYIAGNNININRAQKDINQIQSDIDQGNKIADVLSVLSKNDIFLTVDLSRLPKPVNPQFIGRKDELDKLNVAFKNRAETGIVTIIADGGIGKSALTDKWISDLKKLNYGGIKRVFAWSFYSQGVDQHTFASSQEFFLNALPFFGFTGDIPKNDDDKGRELAKCLQSQACLLILDGLEPLQQPPQIGGEMADAGIKEFLLQLHRHRHPQSFVLISSRQPIIELKEADSCLALPLDALHENEGAALLQALQVQGTAEECQAVSQDLQGHTLSLVLLANLLKQYKHGDIGYAKELPPLDSDNLCLSQSKNEEDFTNRETNPHGHTERVLTYYNSLLSDNERRFMHCLALFDRPMNPQEMDVLFTAKPKKPTGLKKLFSPFVKPETHYFQRLNQLSKREWQSLQTGLELKGLLLKESDPTGFDSPSDLNQQRTQWDTHPLIRQFFARQFQAEHPRIFKQAHRVLFDYFQTVPDNLQLNLTDLELLYRAVVHGCLAGEYQTALDDVYINRILRRGSSGLIEYYSKKKLGAYSQNLIALSAFFPQGWAQSVSTGLMENVQARLLSEASFCLMSLGRFAEAVVPREKTTELYVNLSEWRWAEMSNESLIDLLVPLGRLTEAEIAARQAIEYALKTDDSTRQKGGYSKLALVLHQRGQLKQAQQTFAQAEQLQQESQPEWPYLYSLAGASYCALLLDSASSSKDLEQLLERAEFLTSPFAHENRLLDVAFGYLSVARTHQALQQLQTARREFELAIESIQKTGKFELMPQFYLARADFYLSQNELDNAKSDLTTAFHTISRYGMTLYTVDYSLLQARYCLAVNDKPQARHLCRQSEILIEKTGYHLKDKALNCLKQDLQD